MLQFSRKLLFRTSKCISLKVLFLPRNGTHKRKRTPSHNKSPKRKWRMFQNANSTKNSNTKSAKRERLYLWEPAQTITQTSDTSPFPERLSGTKNTPGKTGKEDDDTISWTNTPTREQRG